MMPVTKMQLQQDGQALLVVLDDKYGRAFPVNEMTERLIEEFQAEVEGNLIKVAELQKKLVSSVVVPFRMPAPQGRVQIGDGHA